MTRSRGRAVVIRLNTVLSSCTIYGVVVARHFFCALISEMKTDSIFDWKAASKA